MNDLKFFIKKATTKDWLGLLTGTILFVASGLLIGLYDQTLFGILLLVVAAFIPIKLYIWR